MFGVKRIEFWKFVDRKRIWTETPAQFSYFSLLSFHLKFSGKYYSWVNCEDDGITSGGHIRIHYSEFKSLQSIRYSGFPAVLAKIFRLFLQTLQINTAVIFLNRPWRFPLVLQCVIKNDSAVWSVTYVTEVFLKCRVFHKDLYKFESLYKFIQRTCTVSWTFIM
jgi:hypothetical protein